jgi:hypothetical protein
MKKIMSFISRLLVRDKDEKKKKKKKKDASIYPMF